MRERDVPLGWTSVLVPLPIALVFLLGSYTGEVLPWLHGQVSLAWIVMLSLVMVAFSAAYAAADPVVPNFGSDVARPTLMRRIGGARLLALTGLFFCVYMLSVLTWYAPDPVTSRQGGEWTWWGVPLAVCFWVLSAVEIANETEHAGRGEPADPAAQWGWFVRLRESRSARVAAYTILLGGTIVVAVGGSIPGRVWRRADAGEAPTWQGHGYVTTDLYNIGVTLWASAMLCAAALFLTHAFRARPGGLREAAVRRAWYSMWASAAVVVLMGCFALAAQGILAEPLIDFAIALYALTFAVMLVDASSVAKHRRIKSSRPRRFVGAVATVLATFGVAILVEPALGLLRTALLAVVIAGAVPLFTTVHRALFGIERLSSATVPRDDAGEVVGNVVVEPVPADSMERGALYDVLLGRGPQAQPRTDVLTHWRRVLDELKSVRVSNRSNAPKHPVVYLLFTCNDGLERTHRYTYPDALVNVMEKLFEGDRDEQKFELIDLLHQSARALDGSPRDHIGSPSGPRAMETLEAECAARHPRMDDERSRRLVEMRRAWLFGNAETWTGDMQPIEPGNTGNYKKTRGATRSQYLVRACDAVMSWWIANLDVALAQPGNVQLDEDLSPAP